MLQNTNNYFRIFAIVFVALFIISVILYFFPSSGKVEWLQINSALEKATNMNKPILLYLSNKYSSVNKVANKSIFSNDSIVNFIENTFVPAKLDLDEQSDANIAKKRYMIDNGKFSIILDKFGRGIIFLDNSWSAGVFVEFAKKALEYIYLDFNYYDEAKRIAISENKPMLIFVTNDYYQNVTINEQLQDEKLKEYIYSQYIPLAMMTYEEWDRAILKKYLSADDPALLNKETSVLSSNQIIKKSPSELILIVSPIDDKVLGKVIIAEASKDWIQDIQAAIKVNIEEEK